MITVWKWAAVTIAIAAGLLGVLVAADVVRVRDDSEAAATEVHPHRRKQNRAMDSLPYLGGIPMTEADRDRAGVTFDVPGKSGDYLYVHTPLGWEHELRKLAPASAPWLEAPLIDTRGNVLHTWASEEFRGARRGWRMPRIAPNGDFYVLVHRKAVLKLDWDSNTIWKAGANFHHDFAIEDDGGVIALQEDVRELEYDGVEIRIHDNALTFIDPDGVITKTMWFSDVFADEEVLQAPLQRLAKRARAGKRRPGDIFHANTVEILRGDPKGPWPRGAIMTSFRHRDLVSVISRDGEVLWMWGPDVLQHQHDPSELPNGNILVFDNGTRRKWSRVLEVDPSTGEVVWDWPKQEGEDFYTSGRGLSQLLPNGNILVVSSNQGKAFQITREGEKVWEWWSPYTFDEMRLPFRIVALTGEALEATRQRLANR